MTQAGRFAAGLALAALALPPLAAPARAQPAQADAGGYPDNNLREETGKPGVFAYRHPGPYYGVSAYMRRKGSDDADDYLRTLARMVLMRAAQLALDNDREYFSIVGQIGTATTGARDVVVRGQAASRAADQCGRNASGQWYCIPGAETPGTSDRISRDPGVFGRRAMVRIWTDAEARRIRAGTMPDKPAGELLSAEAGYIAEYRTRVGDWPTIYEIYENRASEGERALADGGPGAAAGRLSAAKAYAALGRRHAADGDMAAANAAWASAKALIEDGLAQEGVTPGRREE